MSMAQGQPIAMQQQAQQLALPAPAPAAQPLPVPVIVHHNNQFKPAAIMHTGERMERVDRMEKYRT